MSMLHTTTTEPIFVRVASCPTDLTSIIIADRLRTGRAQSPSAGGLPALAGRPDGAVLSGGPALATLGPVGALRDDLEHGHLPTRLRRHPGDQHTARVCCYWQPVR